MVDGYRGVVKRRLGASTRDIAMRTRGRRDVREDWVGVECGGSMRRDMGAWRPSQPRSQLSHSAGLHADQARLGRRAPMPCPARVGGSTVALHVTSCTHGGARSMRKGWPRPILPSMKPYPLQRLPSCAAVLPPASLARSARAAVDVDNAPCAGLAQPPSGGERRRRDDACGYGRAAREEIRALAGVAGVAALALCLVHMRAVAVAGLGAGSAKAGWAWRRWWVWRRRRKRRLRKLGLGEDRAAGGERAHGTGWGKLGLRVREMGRGGA
ncbi:hypothetical protein GUJ93_ZPchr0008g13915 [Zizania palustris]|uniref:Uncharacterized protein n=1 Tax=Zizania palustris TaxID=103762 RepID=A0A8J5V4J5_ZIZPA|nr:hypothetical protein GUJ93_ZPchr0008g13915 [Zizania palustris]